MEDLEQFDSTLDSLKERESCLFAWNSRLLTQKPAGFNNLIELEFNVSNAVQADNSAFLSTIATLFLPVSFLASLFGITTVTWPVIWYLWAAIPIFVVVRIFVFDVKKSLVLLIRKLRSWSCKEISS